MWKSGCMKTTIDIPDVELKDAMRFLQVKTKRQAVVVALREFNRRHRMARLIRFSGTCDFDSNELTEQREVSEHAGRLTP